MPSPPDDPAFWYRRAAEARAAATQMSDPLSSTTMLTLAARYERLANRLIRGGDILSGAGSTDDKHRVEL